MRLAEYQIETIEKLVKGFKELTAAAQPNATMVLKAPTGSGKTLMIAKMLEEIKNDDLPDEFVFIWASMGDLAHQSYEKLSKQYLVDSEYNMLEIEKVQPEAFSKNTILFCNWEKLYTIKKELDDDGNTVEIFDNIFVRIDENGRNLQTIMSETRNAGRKVVLIVDEAHRTYLGKNSKKLVDRVIKPNLIIEVSATPLTSLPDGYYENNIGRWVEVPLNKVIASGLIKKETIINNNIGEVINNESADTAVLAAALNQRERLVKKFRDLGKDINPLVLIQLPSESANEVSSVDESTMELVENYMATKGITYENGKLAVWISNNHYPTDVKTATVPNNSPIEVLIFKQAIAVGWDCPRASILVMLRDIQSVIFEIQTVGRILRMPEPEVGHYPDDELNSAYVFTNINSMALHEDDDTKTFFKLFKSTKTDSLNASFIWPSVYRKRVVGQRHRLNQYFRKMLWTELDKKFDISALDSKAVRRNKVDCLLEIEPDELTIPILSDLVFEHMDTVDKRLFENAQKVSISADSAFIERTFNNFLKCACSPYAPHDSSRILKSALYKWFSDCDFEDESDIQRIVACSESNQKELLDCIGSAKDHFSNSLDKETELVDIGFSIPQDQEYGDLYEKCDSSKHALQPYYRYKNQWNTEKNFEKCLENSSKVEWWYKNGTEEPKYFGIRYDSTEEEGKERESIFYPDYIVRFTDGTTGIFDTKSGDTLLPDKQKGKHVDRKANALQLFIRNYSALQNKYMAEGIITTPQRGLWGGIVNVLSANNFKLQADAKTHDMAIEELSLPESVLRQTNYPQVGYNPTAWYHLTI